MTPLLTLALYVVLLTFVAVLAGAFLRNREWTLEGMRAGLSNRDQLDEPTPLGGRALRTAENSKEAALLFLPLALIAHAAGADAEVLLGAQVFFWARLAYVPIYLAGVIYVRSLVWMVGVVGLGMMVAALL